MAIHKILKMGDPRLLRTAQLVPPTMFGSHELKQLIQDMYDTMRANDGVGLAAPQIGVDWQLVIFGFEHNERYSDQPSVPQTILLNPVITPLGTEQEDGWEGCLSLPGLRGVVPRWKHIRYEAVDPDGVAIQREVSDFHARVVQHECDHLFGKLYPMRMKDFAYFGFSDALFPDQTVAESIPEE
jgi:peptide deformylase